MSMTDPDLWHYFVDEIHELEETEKVAVTVGDIGAGAARSAKAFGSHLLEHASAPLKALDPSGEYLRAGWNALSNQEVIARQRLGVEGAKGLADKLRAGGWLAGFRDTGGASKVLRHLPGRKALFVGQAGLSAARELGDKETAEGRKRGLGERLGRAGMGAATSLVGAGLGSRTGGGQNWIASGAGGLAGGMIGERLGAGIGGTVGRAADVAAKKLKRPRPAPVVQKGEVA